MLVDADKAKEKLAKVCEGLAFASECAAAIRQADLTDCRPMVSESGETYLGQIEAEERIAELKKALEMIYDKWENGDPCYECPDESAGFLGNAINLTEEEEHLVLRLIPAIDAAKEGK